MSTHIKPETLASIGGLSMTPGAPGDSVLLMIDGQREYTTGRLPLAGVDAAVEEGARLLAFAREQRMPVFHAIHHSRPGAALFDPLCVSASARSALDHGFRSTVVAGATATRDLPNPSGKGVTMAETIQQGTLAALSDRFSAVIADTYTLSLK